MYRGSNSLTISGAPGRGPRTVKNRSERSRVATPLPGGVKMSLQHTWPPSRQSHEGLPAGALKGCRVMGYSCQQFYATTRPMPSGRAVDFDSTIPRFEILAPQPGISVIPDRRRFLSKMSAFAGHLRPEPGL